MRKYFYAQLANSLVIHAARYFLGTRSPVYAAIYSAFTIFIIISMFGIVADKMKRWILAWMAGVLVSLICFVALPRPIHYYNFVAIAEGMTLATTGALLIFNAKKGLYLALGVLWLALSCWRLTYCLEMNDSAWRAMNLYFPALLCVGFFTLVGALARRKTT